MGLIRKVARGAGAVASMLGGGARAAGGAQTMLGYHLARMQPEEVRRYIQAKPRLDPELMSDARLYPDRDAMLEALPKGGTVGEIGSDTGHFSIRIAETCRPDALHLFDIEFGPLREDELRKALGDTPLHKHLGDSSASVGAFPPKSFDWFYIDGDHGYDGVVRDLAAADAALKPGGYFMCNDYTVWAPMEAQPYGVPRAINEFIMRRRYRIVGYAFHFAGHDDILLQKPHDAD